MKSTRHLRALIFLLTIHIQLFAQPWVQKGSDINGASAHDHSGRSVSMNGDGTMLLIGSPGYGAVATYEGSGRVFRWNGSGWQQLGATIYGEHALDQLGYAVCINEDATKLAMGSPWNDDAGVNAGHVRVYFWDNTDWSQLGADIDGETPGDLSTFVSLNAFGNIIAIGSPENGGNGNNSGHVRVFEYDWSSGSWILKGSNINGEATEDYSGQSVSLNNDGTVLAIGAGGNDGNGIDAGHVRVYEWDGSVWTQKGNDIDGENADDGIGFSVSISGDGNTVAAGAPGNDDVGFNAGSARVFSFNGSNWVQKGIDIDGNVADDESGFSISLSDGGDTVAIGATPNGGLGPGYAHIYGWNGSAWIQVGSDIFANGFGVGESVSLNNRGSTVAIGAYLHNGAGLSAGQVTVFEDITVGVSENENHNLFAIYPNPSINETTINLGKKYETITVAIKNNVGQIIRTETFYNVELIEYDFKLAPGCYFAEITSDREYITTTTFVKM